MIYIIGGNGFVGSAIVRRCQSQEIPHQVLTRDNLHLFTGSSCDILINANGNSKKYMSVRDPLWDFDASVRSVRGSLVDIKATRYIQLSSCDVYPDCSSPQLTREDLLLDVSKQSPYGFHKYLAEQCVMHASDNWLIFRMGGFVGRNLAKNAVFDILNGGPLWLDPLSELQFINTDDAADIILKIAMSNISGEIINLCGKGIITLQEIVNTVGKDIEIKAGSPRVRYDVSIEKLIGITDVPETRNAVLSFVEEQIRAR
jgi:nucleoside-diphosphate-sugar epimerase